MGYGIGCHYFVTTAAHASFGASFDIDSGAKIPPRQVTCIVHFLAHQRKYDSDLHLTSTPVILSGE